MMKKYLLKVSCRVLALAALLFTVNPVFAALQKSSREALIEKRKTCLENRHEGKTVVERILGERNKNVRPIATPVKKMKQANTPLLTSTGNELYGFLMSDETEDYMPGIVSISLDENATTTLLFDSELHIMSGTLVQNELYLGTYSSSTLAPTGLYAKDVDTGEERLVVEWGSSDPFFYDMTYEPASGVIYAIGGGLTDEIMSLYSISPADGSYEMLFGLDGMLYTLAAGADGVLYGIDDYGYLYAIYPEEYYSEYLGWTGYFPAYLQSMTYNPDDRMMYWAMYTEYGTSSLITFDPLYVDDTAMPLAEVLGYNAEIGALYFRTEPVNMLVPSAPTDFEIMGGGLNNPNNVSLIWCNPSTALDGSELTALESINIYRNGELVRQETAPTVGGFRAWTDTNVPTGMTTYRITATNEQGEGSAVEGSIYVGMDVPAQVGNLTLAKVDETSSSYSLTLSWTAPTAGQHNGYFDASTLRYRVVRYPDAQVMVEETTDLTFTDESITEMAGYSYDVVAINDDGEGLPLRSNTVIVGPAIEVPHIFSFDTEADRSMWVIVDANQDGCTWYFDEYWGGDNRYFMHYYYNEDCVTGADDWFFSAPVHIEAGKQYMLTYDVRLGGSLGEEKFRVALCNGTTPYAEVQEVDRHENDVASNFNTVGVASAFVAESTGDYNIGFHCYSDPNQYFVQILNISIKEVISTDAACTELRGLDVAVNGEDTRYDVVVSNTGATLLTDFTVQVGDVAGNVYGEVDVVDYELDINSYVVVPVTCQITTSALSTSLVGKVLLNGDENSENDTSAAIEVEVKQDAKKYDLATVGNQYSTSYVSYLPFDFHEQYSVQQMLYAPAMLGFEAASIERLGFYYYVQQGDYAQNIKVKVSMVNLGDEVADLSNWVDPSMFTLVYEGEMTLDENNTVYMITLDTPFGYDGNKLCIMTETDGGCDAYFYNYFRSSRTEDESVCSMSWSENEMTFDPNVPGMETFIYPNLAFLLDTDYVSSVGSLKELGYKVSTLADEQVDIIGDYDSAVLYSIDGKMLQSCDGTAPVAVGDYQQGIYIIKVWSDGVATSHKIIVKH